MTHFAENPDINIRVERKTLNVPTRKLKTDEQGRIQVKVGDDLVMVDPKEFFKQEDIKAVYNLDVDAKLTEALAQELSADGEKSRYRVPPYEVDLKDVTVVVYEDRCMCGSCDTVNVLVKDKASAEVTHYNRDVHLDIDAYDQIDALKRVIMEMAGHIKENSPSAEETLEQKDYQKMVEKLLNDPYFLPHLTTDKNYSREEDDSEMGAGVGVTVRIDSFGDIYLWTTGEKRIHRFRTMGGGGNSLRTRNALMILAEAMRLDSESGRG